MSCPSIRCRNVGSGYVKESAKASSEMDTKLQTLLAARQAQDNIYYPTLPVVGSSTTIATKTGAEPQNKNSGAK